MGLLLFLIVSWLIFAFFEGLTEARLWHHKYKVFKDRVVNTFDSHKAFAIQRGVVLIIMSILPYLHFDDRSFFISGLFFLANALIFSFVHNGVMYSHRNYLSKQTSGKEIYPKKWFDQSTTSSAVLTKVMTPVSRTVQFVVGMVLHAIIILYFI